MRRIPVGTVINNQVSGTTYRIKKFLGQGGFGAAYVAVRINDHGRQYGGPVCLKFTNNAAVWHGEAFFGDILHEMNNVVKQREAFPTTMVQGRSNRMVFVIEMDYMETGTVLDACADGRLPWEEHRVARKVRGLLKPLAQLHNMGVSHRDISPGNVYIANMAVLKLGDYGITKAGFKKSGVPADVANWIYAPKGIGAFWSPADDVYQVGLLMLTLLAGEAKENTVHKADVNPYTSSNYGLRSAIKQAISVKSKRPQTASALLELLPEH